MIVLELRFPAGRFHATPWGRHVNEGAVEWPPSPWRLLRSLIACWYLKARNEIEPELVNSLIDALAARNPSFALPAAGQGHTRHYLPFNEGKNEKTTKVFDTFIQLSPLDGVLVAWDVTLPPAQLEALRMLAHRLGYFGRGESLVEARVLAGVAQIQANAELLPEGSEPGPGQAIVRVLAPQKPDAYAAWRRDFMAKVETALGPKPTSAQRKKLPSVPAALFAALHADTGELQAAGWNLPPGAEYVNYVRDEKAFASAARSRPASRAAFPTVARYAVVSAVLPRLTQAVSVGDRVHRALCKLSGQASIFTGRDSLGNPLSSHPHASIFCEANGTRDVITHLSVWAKSGFDEDASLALRRLKEVWGHGGHDLRLVLTSLGQPETFPDCRIFQKSKVWRSATPFVSTRYAKTFRDGRLKMDNGWQTGSAGHDLWRLLALDPLTAGAQIKRDAALIAGARQLRCVQFQTIRHGGGGSRGDNDAAAFTITFEHEVTGPLAFGYGAHFGLGLFIPADADEETPKE